MGSSTTFPHFLTPRATNVTGFLGRYEYQMDAKGRVSLPSSFRRAAEDDRFVLLQWEELYLTLFPLSVWTEVQERLLEYRRAEKAAWSHVREITSNAVEVVPDKQGRILIPGWLQKAASLKGKVLLNGNIDRVEVWNPKVYAKAVSERGEDFGQFAHRIFG